MRRKDKRSAGQPSWIKLRRSPPAYADSTVQHSWTHQPSKWRRTFPIFREAHLAWNTRARSSFANAFTARPMCRSDCSASQSLTSPDVSELGRATDVAARSRLSRGAQCCIDSASLASLPMVSNCVVKPGCLSASSEAAVVL